MRASSATLLVLLALTGACARTSPPRPGPTAAVARTDGLLAEARTARRAGRLDEAIRRYADAIDSAPASVPAHLGHVALLLAQGRRSEALAIYRRRAASANATSADRTMHARLETDGSPSALQGIYQQAAREDPGQVWWRLALAEVELAEAADAQARREEALARSDRRSAELSEEDGRRALERADAAIAVARQLDDAMGEVALFGGLAAAVAGDLAATSEARRLAYERARAELRRAVRLDEDLVEAWEALGDVHARLGDHDRSLAALLAAVARAPADAHLRLAVGVELLRTGWTARAAEQFEQAARLRPRDVEPWLYLGDARAKDARWSPALEAYDEALRRRPTDTDALLRQGMAYENLGRLDEARTSYERYLHHGGDREAMVNRRIDRLVTEGERP